MALDQKCLGAVPKRRRNLFGCFWYPNTLLSSTISKEENRLSVVMKCKQCRLFHLLFQYLGKLREQTVFMNWVLSVQVQGIRVETIARTFLFSTRTFRGSELRRSRARFCLAHVLSGGLRQSRARYCFYKSSRRWDESANKIKFQGPTAAAGTAAQWLQIAQIRRKEIHLLLFHEFFKASFFMVSHSFIIRSYVLTLYQNII